MWPPARAFQRTTLGRRHVLIAGGLTLVAIALRAPRLSESLFGDEIYTFDIVTRSSLVHVLQLVHQTENNPPLYFMVAWLGHGVGDPQTWIRVPSLIAGVATIPLVYALGVRTIGERGALIGAGMLALSPFHVFYSTEARGYALAAFFVTLSTLALVDAVQTSRRRSWALFAIASAAALYSHYTTAFVLLAQAGWALYRQPRQRVALMTALIATAALYLPWLPYLQSNGGLAGVGAFYPFSLKDVATDLGRTLPGHPFMSLGADPGRVGLALFLIAIAGAALRWKRGPANRREPLLLLGALAFATPVGLALYSAVSTHIFAPRNLIASVPAFCLLVGALVGSAGRIWAPALTIALVGALALGSFGARGTRSSRPPWKEAAAYVDATSSPQDPVVSVSVFPVADFLGKNPLVESLAIHLKRPHPLVLAPFTGGGAWTRLATARRVFAVVAQLPGVDAPPQPPRLDARFTLVARRTYRGLSPISVFTYLVRGRRGPA